LPHSQSMPVTASASAGVAGELARAHEEPERVPTKTTLSSRLDPMGRPDPGSGRLVIFSQLLTSRSQPVVQGLGTPAGLFALQNRPGDAASLIGQHDGGNLRSLKARQPQPGCELPR
jgi:hypothetical protein